MREGKGAHRPRAAAASVVAGAFLLRVLLLSRLPPGPFADEAYTAYDAFSLLRTGRDLWGHAWPLYFASWGGDAVEGTYRYLCLPFVALLGPTTLAVRLPAALAGTATVLLTYLLGRRLLGAWPGVLAAALLAISPWHLQFSRIGFRGILVPLFAVGAAWCAAAAAGVGEPGGRRRPWLWMGAAVLVGGGVYSYSVGKLFFPLFGALLLALFARQAWDRKAVAAGLVLLATLIALPAARETLSGRGEVRFDKISALRPEAIDAAAERFRASPGLGWIAGSRVAVAVASLAENFASHFSPRFLVTAGDANLRHSVPGVGQMFRVEALLALVGLAVALRRRRRVDGWILGWLLLGAVGDSLTTDRVPNALRSLAELPAPQLLAASGALAIVGFLRPRWRRLGRPVGAALALLLAAESLHHLTLYATRYPAQAEWEWNAGYAEGIAALDRMAPAQARKIVARPEDWRVHRYALNPYYHSLILVGAGIDPARFQAHGLGPWEVSRIPERGPVGRGEVPAGAWLLLPADRADPADVARYFPGPDGRPLLAVIRGP